MPICVICHEPIGDIVLLGAAYKEEAPMHMIMGIETCKACQEKYLVNGVLLLETNDAQTSEHITPTGTLAVITVEAFKRITNIDVPAKHIAWVKAGFLEKMRVV
jgi:hypothetical protein